MTSTPDRPRADATTGPSALAGALAALGGLAVAELAGLALPGRPSPVSLVADRVVAAMPNGPREALIGAVGTLDKPLLVTGIVLGVALGGAAVGILAGRRRHAAPWLFAAGAAVGWVAAWDSTTVDALPLTLVFALGYAAALLLWGQQVPRALPTAVDSDASHGAVVERRALLRATLLVGLGTAVGLGVVAVARRGSTATVEAVRAALRLPAPSDPAPPLPAGTTPVVAGLAPAVTSSADFYQIDVALTPPAVDLSTWALSVTGRVSAPLRLTYDQLLALPSIERYVTLACVSNDVGGDLVGNARWQGVRLTDLLARAGVQQDADLVLGVSVDGFTAGFPRQLLADGRDAMVAYAMDSQPLPVRHGFPARLVVPGLYGYVSATKWLTEVRLTTLADDVPFWLQRGWAADGHVVAASRIDVPRDGAQVAAGPVAVAGRAWHQHAGVGAVEVSLDDGPWERADLAASLGVDAWRLWSWRWQATPGTHRLRVRMLDLDGAAQDPTDRPVFPGAATGLHTITVDVA